MNIDLDGARDAAAGRIKQVPRTPAAVPKVARRVLAVDNDDGDGRVGLRKDAVAGGAWEMLVGVFSKT